jgi:superfamily I DNA/RNA helicase
LEEGVPGKRILLISFTRVAAADLRDKVARLEVAGAEDVRATTLHGYCFGLLQREDILVVTGRTPRILLDHEADLLLRDIGGDFGDIRQRRRLLEAFVAGWARGLADHPGLAPTGDERDFENVVMRWLREHSAMLIGEVVPEAFRYLSMNPTSEALSAIDHVIVDEYQDLNLIEQRLLEILAEGHALCIAGDDDQSIYSVRYANPEGILAFLDRHDVEPHHIDECGRCPSDVLSMANSLIAQAPGRNKPDLKPFGSPEVGDVALVQWPSLDAEIDGITAAIADEVGSGRRDPGEILVLTNWRKTGESIRVRLRDVEIAARSFFTEEELSTDKAREAIALLRLIVNPTDAPAMRVILGLGDQAGRTDAYQRLTRKSREMSESQYQILERLHAGDHLGVSVPALVERFGRAVARSDDLRLVEPSVVVDELFPEGEEETQDLRDVAVEALGESQDAADLLRAMIESITQDDVPQTPNFVRIMSLHKSKGLTSKSVYVVGAVDGVLPTIRSSEEEVVEECVREGRRLFYVGITRAAERLVISSAASVDLADANARGIRKGAVRRLEGRFTVRTIASPYVAELGSTAPRVQRGQDWLSS